MWCERKPERLTLVSVFVQELLAHVLIAQGGMERANRLCATLKDGFAGNQYEEQESVLSFQLAYCAYSQNNAETARRELANVSCCKTLPLVHVDAHAMQQMMATQALSSGGGSRRRARHSEAWGGIRSMTSIGLS